jgi:uncharacterized protein with PQ loop repeat
MAHLLILLLLAAATTQQVKGEMAKQQQQEQQLQQQHLQWQKQPKQQQLEIATAFPMRADADADVDEPATSSRARMPALNSRPGPGLLRQEIREHDLPTTIARATTKTEVAPAKATEADVQSAAKASIGVYAQEENEMATGVVKKAAHEESTTTSSIKPLKDTATGKSPQMPILNTPSTKNIDTSGSYFSAGWQQAWVTTNMRQLALLLQGLTFGVIVKALCMAGNVLVQVSPYPQVNHWSGLAGTGDADAAPYVSIAFSGWQWCFYGTFAYFMTQQSGFLILVDSNCLGACLGSYYVYAFYQNCNNLETMNSFNKYLTAVCTLVGFHLCMAATLPPLRALFIDGIVASFCSFVGAMSMLVSVPMVIRTKNSSTIPGLLASANFASAVAWCVAGWMLQDPLVYVPNIANACSSFTCIFLKIKYGSNDEYESNKLGAGDADNRLAEKAAVALRQLYQPRPVQRENEQGEDHPVVPPRPSFSSRPEPMNSPMNSPMSRSKQSDEKQIAQIPHKDRTNSDEKTPTAKTCDTGGTF